MGKEGRFVVLVSHPVLQAPREGRCALPAPCLPSAPGLQKSLCQHKKDTAVTFRRAAAWNKAPFSSVRVSFTAHGCLLRIFYARVPVCSRMLPFPRHGSCWHSLKSQGSEARQCDSVRRLILVRACRCPACWCHLGACRCHPEPVDNMGVTPVLSAQGGSPVFASSIQPFTQRVLLLCGQVSSCCKHGVKSSS